MKATIRYACKDCNITFSAYCTMPNHIENYTVHHSCEGVSKPAGVDGVRVPYVCDKCGHITPIDITDIIPAMASRRHGCGAECYPA